LMKKLSNVLSKKVVKFLQERAKADEKEYLKFYSEFGQFIKEGVYTDFTLKNEAAKLLRFESSRGDSSEMVSLDEYIGRMSPDQQDNIYWLVTPSRDSAEQSAYMEAFKAKGIEVLYLYSTVDEFVMSNLMNYGGKSLISAENASDLDVEKKESEDALSEADSDSLKAWMLENVKGVKEVRVSSRLVDSPAIVVGHESAAMRKMMQMAEAGKVPELPPQTLEINATHPIIRNLASARASRPELATLVAQQVFSNALITAGLLDDPRQMLTNLNAIMENSLASDTQATPAATSSPP